MLHLKKEHGKNKYIKFVLKYKKHTLYIAV